MLTRREQFRFGYEDGQTDRPLGIGKHRSLHTLAYRLGYALGWRAR